MQSINDRDIIGWLGEIYPISRSSDREVRFPCPKCGHTNFYFNVRKKVGWCHRDSCHYAPSITDMILEVGYGPENRGFTVPLPPPPLPKESLLTELPEHSQPIARDGLIGDLIAAVGLSHRGVSSKDIEKFNIHSTMHSIIVPVYGDEGELVQYVRRWIDRSKEDIFSTPKHRRYLYGHGVNINNYILGWKECRLWDKLTLVENTFVSMWLRDELNCSTNFGSNLSTAQIYKILNSYIKTVVILWDEGAGLQAEKACAKLRKFGIPSAYLDIKGQPDDHSLEYLSGLVLDRHTKLKEGRR